MAQLVEHSTGDLRVASSRLAMVILFIRCFVLVQPTKTAIHTDITEKLLGGK